MLGTRLSGRAHAYGVLDGHGGSRASTMLARHLPDALRKRAVVDEHWSKNALTVACEDADASICQRANADGWDDGSTALVAIVETAAAGNAHLTLMQVGDCDAILCGLDGVCTAMVTRHRPTEPTERARLDALGVEVSATGRVRGLAVSRAFGDASFKRGDRVYLTAQPEIVTRELTADEAKSAILVLACDGLWDFISHQEACNILIQALPLPSRSFGADELSNAALQLADAALDRGSDDNVSVLVVPLSGT